METAAVVSFLGLNLVRSWPRRLLSCEIAESLKPSCTKCMKGILEKAGVESICIIDEVLKMFEGEWGGERGARRDSRSLWKICVHRQIIMLYFVGILRSEVGMLGVSGISRRLCNISANLYDSCRQPV